MIHQFTKANVPALLYREIMDCSMAAKVNEINIVGTLISVDTDDTTAAEESVLSAVIAAHANDGTILTYEKMVEDNIEFGHKLIKAYGLKNVLRGYTTAQISQVMTDLEEITNLLQSGAIETAKEKITAFTPTSEVPQEDKDEFLAKINKYLGV